MTTKVYCDPENAADSAYAEIVDVTIGSRTPAKLSLPHVAPHPRWRFIGYVAYGVHKKAYGRPMEPYEAFVSPEEATVDNPMLSLCDYENYGRYELAGVCERIVAIFEYVATGKILVTETFPKKLIISGGKPVIDR